ncbi:RelA/SpoT domain-containing protein [Roseomonas gilardii]|uniref:RelA/SpoT domain-containing protein n=1 Tax=Roseomonas gilardii TaxID=257708 RepID=UPI0011A34D9B|nr:RelA/SpoT domain-containing protein [Roseomonas gilardii]
MFWVPPKYSPSRVKAAGKRIRDDKENIDDLIVFENWRASHAYVLNTFQTNLRRRAKGNDITVAQRLKRRPTIIDKLVREPTMQLNTMHDIAGCRLIFTNQKELTTFRRSLHDARFEHRLRHAEEDRYNYIKKPKPSGYRGIHDVYEYVVNSEFGKRWNGLHLEIQYRTVYQHAWATAVEAADLVTSSRIKFSSADQSYKRFFQICSEIIARAYENQPSCMPDLSNKEVISEFERLQKETSLFSTLSNLRKSSNLAAFKTNTILILHSPGSGTNISSLETETYDNINKAIERYSLLEKEMSGKADIVLVRAENAENIRDAFRNYFSDTHDFVTYIDEGRKNLLKI